MFGLKRKKLSEVQLQKAEAYGEKVGTFLSRYNPVRKANIYAARHRLWVLPAIVMATFTFTLVGLFLQPLDYEISNYDTLMIKLSKHLLAFFHSDLCLLALLLLLSSQYLLSV